MEVFFFLLNTARMRVQPYGQAAAAHRPPGLPGGFWCVALLAVAGFAPLVHLYEV